MESRKIIKKLGGLLSRFIFLGLVFISLVLIRGAMPLYNNDLYMLVETIFLLVLVNHLQVFIHELGHLVFGKLSGYRLIFFRLASLVVIRTGQGLELKRLALEGTAGQCLMCPPEERGGDFPFILYNLGGVILNILVGLVGFFIYRGLEGRSLVRALGLGIFIFGFYLALINGLPLRLSGGATDGYNIRLLLGDKSLRRAYYNQLKINDGLVRGLSYSQLDPSYFVLESDWDKDNHLLASIAILKMKRYLDLGDYGLARKMVLELVEDGSLGKSEKKILEGELVYMDLLGERPAEGVLLEHCERIAYYRKVTQASLSINRILYACDIMGGKREEALGYKENLEILSRTYPFKGDYIMEKDLCQRIDRLV